MPTGYTAKLCENGQPFDEFVWTCARAFGALLWMQDDPTFAPIPTKFEPDAYHLNAMQKAADEAALLEAMGEDARRAYGDTVKAKRVAEYEQCRHRVNAEADRIHEMLSAVRDWTPPTPEHEGLKKFMVDQLTMSLPYNCDLQVELDAAKAKSPMAYWREARDAARESIGYHERKYAEEVVRTGGRNAWLAALQSSVPLPAALTKAD